MTKQQMLDMSVKHILLARQKSVSRNTGSCSYSGTGCGARPFLKDADAAREADSRSGTSWAALARHGLVPQHELDFVSELQSAHDNTDTSDFMSQWVWNILRVAPKYNLSTAVLDAGL